MMECNKEKIGIDRIEDMILLADDIVKALQMRYADYTDEGDENFFLCYQKCGDMEDREAFHRIVSEEKATNREHEYLLMDLFHDDSYDLTDVLELTAAELIEKHLSPILSKALCLFLKGTDFDTGYVADETVSDDYLRKLFAIRVRDMMIIHACQRL